MIAPERMMDHHFLKAPLLIAQPARKPDAADTAANGRAAGLKAPHHGGQSTRGQASDRSGNGGDEDGTHGVDVERYTNGTNDLADDDVEDQRDRDDCDGSGGKRWQRACKQQGGTEQVADQGDECFSGARDGLPGSRTDQNEIDPGGYDDERTGDYQAFAGWR